MPRLTKYPHLVRQWHPTKNDKLQPADFTPHSGKKVWWRCQKGHEWLDTQKTLKWHAEPKRSSLI